MSRELRAVLIGAWLALPALPSSAIPAQARNTHALDPLSGAEITRTVSLLKASGRLTDQARFGTISVQPQDKRTPTARGARVLGYDWSRNEGFVAVVDLVAGRVASWTVVSDEPPMRLITIRRAEEIAHADVRWVSAMKARGIDTARVGLILMMSEGDKLAREGSDRVVGVFVWLRDGVPPELTVRGLDIRVNLTKGILSRFADEKTSPRRVDSALMKALTSPRPALAPLRVEQRSGASVAIRGNSVAWDRWKLRVGIDPRRGLEIHDVSFTDAGRVRPVLYSGAVSEIISPYGDSTFGTWYPRDEGDYGMGIYSMSSAVPLNDAPANAAFLSATMHDHRGRPIAVPRAIAVYERDGGVLWRHANISRRARQLVISSFSTIDNYDYQFNWILSQDGTIEGEVLLSGIMNYRNVALARDTAHAGGHVSYGHLVAPEVRAPNHQHFFSYRLDLDVDGTSNTVYEMNTQATPRGPDNPKGENFSMSERPLATEHQGFGDVSFASARAWRVVNTRTRNSLGQFTGYSLIPGAVAPPFYSPGSAPRRRAGFVNHQLWVTPFMRDEQYAAGEFQNLAREGDGLPSFTKGDRSIRDTDVVLWYTLGITHIPRPEDWPYMPAHRGGFKLLPISFFSRSPVLDVPATVP